MREIIFRGKRAIDGKWVESCCPLGEMHSGTVTYDFKSETVCQYTGMPDKNGRKIFEGDIVRNKSKWGENIGIVKFKNARFMVDWRLRNKYSDKGISSRTDDLSPEDEIIGNIFDNPELIGEN